MSHPLSAFTSTNLILLFHIVPSKGWFADTLRWVRGIYDFVSAGDIESYYYGGERFKSSCHVTFDDGERTVYENAFPVLRDMDIPATVFVSPKVVAEGRNYWFQELRVIRGTVGDAKVREAICENLGCDMARISRYNVLSIMKCMKLAEILSTIESLKTRHGVRIEEQHNVNGAQLSEMIDSGVFSVGGHTMNHPILSNESDETAEREIRQSLEQLSRMTGRGARYFSHPNGKVLDYGERETGILRRNGVRLNFTYNTGYFGRKNDPLCLPRAGFATSGNGENPSIVPKILLVPVWDRIRTLARLGRTEEAERREITRSCALGDSSHS
jgi:peptidoglycan/xylan/chitin deacetylase (PgdA/CDA1 family)